jgi:hypothetical protein
MVLVLDQKGATLGVLMVREDWAVSKPGIRFSRVGCGSKAQEDGGTVVSCVEHVVFFVYWIICYPGILSAPAVVAITWAKHYRAGGDSSEITIL